MHRGLTTADSLRPTRHTSYNPLPPSPARLHHCSTTTAMHPAPHAQAQDAEVTIAFSLSR